MNKNIQLNYLKRHLKKKVKVSMATVTIFLITGSVGFAQTTLPNSGGEYNDTNYVIELKENKVGLGNGNYSFKNEGDTTIKVQGKKGSAFKKDNGDLTVEFLGKTKIVPESSSEEIVVFENSGTGTMKIDIDKGLEIKDEDGKIDTVFSNSEDSKGETIVNSKGKIEIDIKGGLSAPIFAGSGKITLNLDKGGDITSQGSAISSGNYIYQEGNNIEIKIDSKEDLNITSTENEAIFAGNDSTVEIESKGGKIQGKKGALSAYGDNAQIIYRTQGGVFGEGENSENGDILAQDNGKVSIISTGDFKLGKILAGEEYRLNGGEVSIDTKGHNFQADHIYSTDKAKVDIQAKDITLMKNLQGDSDSTSFDPQKDSNIFAKRTANVSLEASGDIAIKGGKKGIYVEQSDHYTNKNTITLKGENIEIESYDKAIDSFGMSNIKLEAKDSIRLKTLSENDDYEVLHGAENSIISVYDNSNIKLEANKIELGDRTKKAEKVTKDGEVNYKSNKIFYGGYTAIDIGKTEIVGNDLKLWGSIYSGLNHLEIKKKDKDAVGNVVIANSQWDLENFRKEGALIDDFTNMYQIELDSLSTIELKGRDENGNGSFAIGQFMDGYLIPPIEENDILGVYRNRRGILTVEMDEDAILVPSKRSGFTNLDLGGGTVEILRTYGQSKEAREQNRKYGELFIENLSGHGTFNLQVDSKDRQVGSIVYIYDYIPKNGEKTSINTLKLINSDISTLKEGEKLRFATLGKGAKDRVIFKDVPLYDSGIQDITLKVDKEDFSKDDPENLRYRHEEVVLGTKDKQILGVREDRITLEDFDGGQNLFVRLPNEEEKNDTGDSQDNDITKSVVSMLKSNYNQIVTLDTLNKRMGDMTFANGSDGIWVRMKQEKISEDGNYKLKNSMTQVGYDKAYIFQNGEGHRGIALNYSRGDMDFKNISGNSDVDKYEAMVYDTKLYSNGVYTDLVGRVGYVESDFDIVTQVSKNRVKGDYDSVFAGVGIEVGKRYEMWENSYVEPQTQLQYTYIKDSDYTTTQGTKVDLDDVHSLIGRVGVRFGHDFYKENSKDNTIYLRGDINREFLGEQEIVAHDFTGNIQRNYKNEDMWISVGMGIAKDITTELHIYGEVEKQFGKSRDGSSLQGNLGFRYRLGK